MPERLVRWRVWLPEALARRRVPLGFASGAVVLWLATPTGFAIAMGAGIASIGEGLRFWAAGHLNKSREVTSSGPYRWFAHPLYAGSSMLGLGLAVASRNVVVAVVIALYLAVMLTAAIKTEEAFLRKTFGVGYEHYRHGRGPLESPSRPSTSRSFSLALAIENREHRTLVGIAIALALLALKAAFPRA